MNRAAEPYRKVMDVVNAFQAARILHAGVELGVFARLADEAKTSSQIAAVLQLDARAVELLLNALASLGFLRKEDERFHAAPVTQTYLVPTGPKYLGHLIGFQARRWRDWECLADAVATGKPLREPNMFQDDPEQLELFIRGMHELAVARGDARYLARAIRLGRCGKLLDIGGGPGTHAAMFCRYNRNLQAVVLDLPATLRIARRILRGFDATGRVSLQAGDYRRDPIKGTPYDVVLISNILHSEDADTNRRLLRKAHDALVPGGLLIVKDLVLSADHTEPETAAVFSLAMLLSTLGRVYTFGEMQAWMVEAGFRDMVEVPPEPPMTTSIVLAVRPGKRALVILPRPAARCEPPPQAVLAPAAPEPPPPPRPRRAPRPPVPRRRPDGKRADRPPGKTARRPAS